MILAEATPRTNATPDRLSGGTTIGRILIANDNAMNCQTNTESAKARWIACHVSVVKGVDSWV